MAKSGDGAHGEADPAIRVACRLPAARPDIGMLSLLYRHPGEERVISPAVRALLHVLTAGYAATGAVMFFAPTWASANFAWRISPFVAMTIGGWCLGNAWMALVAARRGDWPLVLCPILYLSLFGVLEAGVLAAFRERVLLGSPLAWLYLATIAATCLLTAAALFDGLRKRPVAVAAGPATGAVTLGFTLAFIVLVAFLGCYGLMAVEGMPALNAGIFPERLSPFSLRAFGAFYLALALSVIPLLWARGLDNALTHGFAAYGLIVLITVAAFVFIGRFDFAARPTQAIYIGIYLLVGAVIAIYLIRYGTGARKA
jgi:hypothetical protein